jgi:predicted permease
MLQLFADNLLPVFLAAGAGYILAARGTINPRPLAQVAFFVLSPCLIFQIIAENHITGSDMVRMGGFTALTLMSLGAAAAIVARLLRWSRSLTAAVVLVAMLPNAGNFGLSVNLFAFGEPGLAQASISFVTAAILTYTVGVFIASMGQASVGEALSGLIKVPTIWAVLLAFVMVQFDWKLPFPVERTVDLLADACIPVFLIVLGMQLRGATWRGRTGPLALTTGIRLLATIAVALGLATVFGLEGPARQAGVLQAAMPSAVINIILATQYDVEPGFVTSAVLVTTVLCPLTLTPLLAYLGA